jgi:hypothetical protein
MTPLSQLNPDYVIHGVTDVSGTIGRLKEFGFNSTTRTINDQQLIFIKLNDSTLVQQLKKECINGYLHGISNELLSEEFLIEQLDQVKRLELANGRLDEAGLTGVQVLPLWDYKDNQRLLKSMIKLSFTEQDVELIRALAGSKVGLYFEFLRLYYNWLAIPAVIGLISHLFFKRFSYFFTIVNSLWAIAFLNSWRQRERFLGIHWNIKGAEQLQQRNPEFHGESFEEDPITGKKVPYSSPATRTLKQIAFIPFGFLALVALVSYQVLCFIIEIFLTELYQGPLKQIMGLVPTILVVVVVPIITAIYEKFVDAAIHWENHEFVTTSERSKIQKMYLYNFLSGYVPLFITVGFYLPFGHIINNYLPFVSTYMDILDIPVIHEHYQINNDRLVGQFGFFTLTSQIISMMLENVVPVTLRLYKERSAKSIKASPEEVEYLTAVSKQLGKPQFDVNAEYRELTLQLGYLVLFGPVWSLAPLISLFFNWIEIRGDLEKLLFECSRPIPTRVESIKPWNTNWTILTSLGAVIGPLVTVMFGYQDKVVASDSYNYLKSPVSISGWKLFGIALISENFAIALNFAIEALFNNIGDETVKIYDNRQIILRRSYVDAFVKAKQKVISIDPMEKEWESLDSRSSSDNGETIEGSTSGFQREDFGVQSALGSKTIPITEAAPLCDIPTAHDSQELETSSVAPSNCAVIGVPVLTPTLQDLRRDNTTSKQSSVDNTTNGVDIDEDRQKSSTPSSHGSSLAGATLPPEFQKRLDSSSKFNVEKSAEQNEKKTVDLETTAGPETAVDPNTTFASKLAQNEQSTDVVEDAEVPEIITPSDEQTIKEVVQDALPVTPLKDNVEQTNGPIQHHVPDDDLSPPKLNHEDQTSSSSVSSPRKKSLLSKVKGKIKSHTSHSSAHGTPKK